MHRSVATRRRAWSSSAGLFASAVLLAGSSVASLQAQQILLRGGWADLSRDVTVAELGYSPFTWGPLTLSAAALVVAGRGADLYGFSTGVDLHPGAHWRLTAALGFGLGTGAWDGDLTTWSAGVGYDLLRRPLGLGIEARYRRLVDLDLGGIELGGRVAIPLGRGGSSPPAHRPAIRSTDTLTLAPSDSLTLLPANARALTLVAIAREAMGAPYLWGGSDFNGFDCSGLIQYSYARIGVALPRTSEAQARAGQDIPRQLDRLAPGDVLTFRGPGQRVTHVGLYAGDGWFIHSTGRGVQLSRLRPDDPNGRWWLERWTGVRRMLETGRGGPPAPPVPSP